MNSLEIAFTHFDSLCVCYTEHGVSTWTSATTMKTLRAVLALLWSIGMAQLGAGFKPNLPPLKDAKVLVVGASGQVGELVRTLLQAQTTHDHASAVLRASFVLPALRGGREA